MNEDSNLQKELEETKHKLQQLEEESDNLKKAIWDMLNYSNTYLVLLSSDMTIKLANWSLATDLGFETESDIVGKCWLEFVPDEIRDNIKAIHQSLSIENSGKYKEVINDIVTLSKEKISVKWFNIRINGKYNMTLSMGLKTKSTDAIVNEESIRSYYKDIIEKDRTMILSLKDIIIKGLNGPECVVDQGDN